MTRPGICLSVLLLVGAGDPPDTRKTELARFQGAWTMSELTWNGRDHSEMKLKLTFKGDEATVEGDDEVKQEYGRIRVKLDPGAAPKLFDVAIGAGLQKDASMEGIYEFKGQDLRLCVKVFGTDRPTEFASPNGSSIVLIVLKRSVP